MIHQKFPVLDTEFSFQNFPGEKPSKPFKSLLNYHKFQTISWQTTEHREGGFGMSSRQKQLLNKLLAASPERLFHLRVTPKDVPLTFEPWDGLVFLGSEKAESGIVGNIG